MAKGEISSVNAGKHFSLFLAATSRWQRVPSKLSIRQKLDFLSIYPCGGLKQLAAT